MHICSFCDQLKLLENLKHKNDITGLSSLELTLLGTSKRILILTCLDTIPAHKEYGIIHHLAWFGNVEGIELFHQRGGNINLKTTKGETALHIAVKQGLYVVEVGKEKKDLVWLILTFF